VVSLSSDGGLLAAGSAGVSVSLSLPAAGPNLYAPGCTGTGSNPLTVVIPAGQSDAGFSVGGCPRGSYPLTAHDPSGAYSDGTAFLGLDAGPASLHFSSAGQQVTAGYCSAQVTFEVDDACGAPIASGGRSISLSSLPPGLAFYSDNACMTAIPGDSLTLGPVATGSAFFFEAGSAGDFDAGLSTAGLWGDEQGESVLACLTLQTPCTGMPAQCCRGSSCGMAGNCCGDLGGACAQQVDCCPGTQPLTCDAGLCCIPNQTPCSGSGSSCCDGNCLGGRCCKSNGVGCSTGGECCSSQCDPTGQVCTGCQDPGASCGNDSDCCSQACDAGFCTCIPSGSPLVVPVSQCSALCCSKMCNPTLGPCPDGGLGCSPCM
jgi:hypothetical protein